MIFGILSIILDILLLNFVNYTTDSIFIFPMFTITYVLTHLYFRKDIKLLLIIFLIYCSVIGVFYLPFAFLLIEYYYISKDKKNFNIRDFLMKILYGLLLYDSLFFIIIHLFDINNYTLSLLIYKIIFTIPLNIFYGFILYFINSVLKKKKIKYKLVW